MIRKATIKDYKRLSISLGLVKNKPSYITKELLKLDILQSECYVLEENKKLIGIGSIVFDYERDCYYIKRVMIFNKSYQGKGYGKQILKELSQLENKIAVTPFKKNAKMRNIIKSLGFKFQYSFNENFLFYLKSL